MKLLNWAKLMLCAVLLMFSSACVTYHQGMKDPEGFPGVKTIVITNQTREGRLDGILKNSVNRELKTRPGLNRRPSEKGVVLTMRIGALDQRRVASARLREKDAVDQDGTSYQSVLFRVRIQVAYEVRNANGAVVMQGTVQGIGDIPRMHDHQVGFQNGCKLAVDDVARQVCDALNDGDWHLVLPAEKLAEGNQADKQSVTRPAVP